ncbi:MAG: hypothetical protein JW932_17895 [Deltaproteobacteria bacterium]|nr:hypothetical protein [Deltaproteobacteria bacterium]
MDVLENGDDGLYGDYFDIQWHRTYDHVRERVLAPFLAEFFEEALESSEIRLHYELDFIKRFLLLQFEEYLPEEEKWIAGTPGYIAFCRHLDQEYAFTFAPRFLTSLVQERDNPLGQTIWDDTRIILPQELPETWRDKPMERVMRGKDSLLIGGILNHFPVFLLVNTR